MARTSSSSPSARVTRAISVHIARLIALRMRGRLNTTVAMASSRSTRTSVTGAPPGSWGWWRWEELNLRHGAYETPALPLSYTAEPGTLGPKADGECTTEHRRWLFGAIIRAELYGGSVRHSE